MTERTCNSVKFHGIEGISDTESDDQTVLLRTTFLLGALGGLLSNFDKLDNIKSINFC